MRLRLAGGLDLTTGALILGGTVLLAASIVAAVTLLAPQSDTPRSGADVVPTLMLTPGRASQALPANRVATILLVDSGVGAGGAARTGDRVDVLGYFSRQQPGVPNVTRVLLTDVPVLAVERAGANVALTLAVARDQALLLQEAQALGAKALVALRPADRGTSADVPSTLSDADLAERLAAVH